MVAPRVAVGAWVVAPLVAAGAWEVAFRWRPCPMVGFATLRPVRARRIGNLLSWERWQTCRRLFQDPFRAHLALAGLGGHDPFSLTWRSGGELRLPPFRRVRSLFAFLFEHPDVLASARPEPDGNGGGLLSFRWEDARLAIRPDSFDFPIFTEVWLRDVYRLARLPRPIGTVVDLGANVGLFSTRAALLGAEVVAVEPVEENRALLRKNLEGCGVATRVRLIEGAISGRSGERLRMFKSPDNSGGHSLQQNPATAATPSEEEVTTVSLEDLFARERVERCDLLKCDVEGAEFEALLAAPLDTLRRVERVAIELHLTPDLPADRPEALRAHLRAAGFTLEEEDGPAMYGGTLKQILVHGSRRA